MIFQRTIGFISQPDTPKPKVAAPYAVNGECVFFKLKVTNKLLFLLGGH